MNISMWRPRLTVSAVVVAVTLFCGQVAGATPPPGYGTPTLQQQGGWLTCGNPPWDPYLYTVTYAFYRDAAATPIGGLDASSDTYAVTVADSGHSFTCVVTATDPSDNTSTSSDPSNAVVVVTPPQNEVAPSISGGPVEGTTIQCDPGQWSGDGVTLSYRWLQNGSAITGATTPDYLVRSSDVGQLLACRVRATNSVGAAAATSSSIAGTADTTSPVVTIAGSTVRSTLRTAKFAFTADETSTFKCKLDSRPKRSCSSPKSYSNLRIGTHVFRVWASDEFGNTSRTPAKKYFNIGT